jgi:hypothetical protein
MEKPDRGLIPNNVRVKVQNGGRTTETFFDLLLRNLVGGQIGPKKCWTKETILPLLLGID